MKSYNINPKLKTLLKAPLILLFLVALLYSFDSIRWTSPIPGGIAELTPLTINGNKQWLLIRGKNKNAPVLLFLHSGPGASHMASLRPYQKKLEEKFIVVQWDQRGSGLSDTPSNPDTLNIPQFTADGIKVSEYLKERFNQDKIYLAGHGWGAALGWLMARGCPQHFKAFASIAPPPPADIEKIRYLFTLGQAEFTKNQSALAELQKLGPPPWTNMPSGLEGVYPHAKTAGRASMGVVLKWINTFRGGAYKANSKGLFFSQMYLSTEYRVGDVFGWIDKHSIVNDALYSAYFQELNLKSGGTELQMPFHMILGERDLVNPMDAAADFYDTVTAPAKNIIIYRDCSHFIMWERPDEYQSALIRLFGEQ